MKNFNEFYKGKISLSQSFWIWLVLANVVFQLAITLLGQLGLFFSYFLIIFKIIYQVFAIIGVWRSATNYIQKKKKVYWGWLAKISAVGYALEVLVFAYILLAPVLSDFKVQNIKPVKEPIKQVQKETEKKKVKEIKEVVLICDGLFGPTTIIFNDKFKTLSDEGEPTTIISWSDKLIEYQHDLGSSMHTHKLDRISGHLKGVGQCMQSYGKAF